MRALRPVGMVALALALMLCTDADASPHRNDRVYQAAMANRAGALDLLREVVDIDSGTGDVAGGAKVEAVLAERLKAIGGEVRNEPAETSGYPDNLVAVFRGAGKGKILIIGHIDTVFG